MFSFWIPLPTNKMMDMALDFNIPLHLIKQGMLETHPVWGCLILNSVFGWILFSFISNKVMVIFPKKQLAPTTAVTVRSVLG